MHFLALVISNEKPTEASLQESLSPFMPRKLDHWALGGRYSGLLEPLDLADTVTGGADCPDFELALSLHLNEGGYDMEMRGFRGSGVDALQAKNFKRSAATPCAVVKDGHWFEPSGEAQTSFLIESLRRDYPNAKLPPPSAEAQADIDRWDARFRKMLSGVQPDQWFSFVDCHVSHV